MQKEREDKEYMQCAVASSVAAPALRVGLLTAVASKQWDFIGHRIS